MFSPVERASLPYMGIAMISLVIFVVFSQYRSPVKMTAQQLPGGMVVIAAPIQIMMYAGDRFLAANLEEIRVAAIGPEDNDELIQFRLRAHDLVSQLNPCHEDNYYMANAMLTWAGSVNESDLILERTTNCRYWDEFPPFFLGFNQFFFQRDMENAQKNIELAASRSEKNRSGMQAIAIAIASKNLNDEKMAIAYLRTERDRAKDPNLIHSLERRLQRLQGLITLRDAQKRFEGTYKRSLTEPAELLRSGILYEMPKDPLRIGYEFVDGKFHLRAVNIGGVEIR